MPTTWTVWTTNCTSSMYTTTSSAAWTAWTTSSVSSTTSNVWYSWNDGVEVVYENRPVDADLERRLAEERERIRVAAEEAEERRKQALARARQLLESMLTHQQKQQLQRERFFEVVARHSRRRYRIYEGSHGNVKLLDENGREVTSYCAQPNGVPVGDSMLAQKLQLEHDEEGFLRVANATPLRRAA